MGDGVAGSADQAQLILIGALSLAVTLVGIALVLNSAIFAENLATRANQDEVGRVSAFEQQSASGATASIRHLHRNNSSHASYGDLEADLGDSIRVWSSLNTRDTARRGQYTDVDYVSGSMVDGTRVAQTDGTAFEPRSDSTLNATNTLSGITSWPVAKNVSRSRDFRMQADRASLASVTRVEAEEYLRNLGSGSYDLGEPPFAVVYDVDSDGTIDHAFTVYRVDDGDSDDDVGVSYYDAGLDVTYSCEVDAVAPRFEVDVSAGTVGGERTDCDDAFAFQSALSNERDLFYARPTEVTGDYQFIVAQDLTEFENQYDHLLGLLVGSFGDFYDPHAAHDDTYSPASPFVEPAVYSADATVTYRSSQVTYNATTTIAPNEPE